MLKAVYFPNEEFLEAGLGSSPSRIWRSIVEGRDVLKKGFIHRIGICETTKIWSMDLLPTSGLRRPLRCNRVDAPKLVTEIIDATTATWDKEKLHEFFTPVDAEVIASIPLCT